MKPALYPMVLFGLFLDASTGLANEPRPKHLAKSTGPMPELLCAVPNPAPKERNVFRLSCHEKQVPPCLPSQATLPLQQILNRLAPARPLGIKLKGNGCYYLTFVRQPKQP